MPRDGIYSVNWKNPMLLGDRHLRLSDLWAAQARRWLAHSIAPTSGGYGLVPLPGGSGAGLQLSHEHGADRLNVHIHQLQAIAPDGSMLIFCEDAFPELTDQLKASVELERNPPRPVRLGVLVEPIAGKEEDGDAFLEVGEPDSQEDPPRKPLKTVALRCRIEADAFSSRSTLKIAEFLWDGVTVDAAQDYLPPMLSLAALPAAAQWSKKTRQAIVRIREMLSGAAAKSTGGDDAETLMARDVLLAWLAAVASMEDAVCMMTPTGHPHGMWEGALRCLRIARTMLGSSPAALEHALKNFVQPGMMKDGNPNYFENLDSFLGEPYDHDHLGRLTTRGLDLLEGMTEVLEFLLGAQPVRQEAPVETDVYYYKDRKYRLADYTARTFEIDEAWHSCYLRELEVSDPKSLILVCDKSLLEQNPRPNAGLWMIDKYEKVKANMFRVNVDAETDPTKVVVHFQEIYEPTVTAVSIASRGLLDFNGLEAGPDEKLRIYYE